MNLADEYLAHLRERGLSPQTIDGKYARILRDFYAFADTWEVAVPEINAFIAVRARSQGRINRIRACLRGFYRWAEREGRVGVRIHDKIEWVRDEAYTAASSLTDEEAQILIAFVPVSDEDALAHCLVALALGLGLQLTVALSLLAENVRLRQGYIVVLPKSSNARQVIVPLPPWAIRALWAYRPPSIISSGTLFITANIHNLSRLMRKHTGRLLGRPVTYTELRVARR